jgi:hypothetical protein
MEFAQINRAIRTFGSVGNGVGTGDHTIMSNGMALGGYPAEVALMHLGIGIPIQEEIIGYAVNGGNANYRFFTHSALIDYPNLASLRLNPNH